MVMVWFTSVGKLLNALTLYYPVYKMGNDNAIAHEVVDVGGTIYSVSCPHDTMRIMQILIEEDKAKYLQSVQN